MQARGGEAVVEGSRQPFSPPVSPESMAREIAASERAVADSLAAAGPDDAATLAARARLGRAYAFADRFDAAVTVLTENCEATERALGADHAAAVIARSDLAWGWRQAGQLSDALPSQESCVADLDRVLGSGSHEAARARVEYGRLLTLTGQRDLARQILEQALADLTRTVGPEHSDTLYCQMRLAACRAAGDTQGAVAAAERTAADCERLLEPDDPEAVSCRAELGTIYLGAGRAGEAVPLLERARADFARVVGPEHTESVRADYNLGHALHHAGDTDRAIPALERALDTAVRVLPPQHRLMSSIRGALAEGYARSGRHADAALMQEQVIRDFRPVSADDAAQLRPTRFFLARYLFQAGRSADATTILEELVTEFDQVGEPADKRSVDARLLLAGLYRSASRKAEADTIYRAVLQDARRVYGRDDPRTRDAERRVWRARRSDAYPITRHPVLGALISAVILAGVVAFAVWPHSPHLAPPPKPGYESPTNAAAGYTAGFFTDHPAAACRYTAPSDRGLCGFAVFGVTVSGTDAELSGRWTIGHTVISGSEAIVDVEYDARGTTNGISVVNTNPNAGLPHAGLSFDAAYQQFFSSRDFPFTVDCVLVDGRWYVDDAQQGS